VAPEGAKSPGLPTGGDLTIITISGPYREPREPAFSYDYSFQRAHWPTAQAVRVKISIAEELDHFKSKVLGISGGSPGQQLRVNQLLTRCMADRKFTIADEEGMLAERRDVMVPPFIGSMSHLFPRLAGWMEQEKDRLRTEIKEKIGI
jgi:hypothetical protein